MTTRKVLLGLTLALVTTLAACGGGSTGAAGVGGLTVTAITGPLPSGGGAPFTVTGGDFSNEVGTRALIRFEASGGATPFAGGTSATAEVWGTIATSTTIDAVSPAAVVCGVASINAFVSVFLESGLGGRSFTAIAIFVAPTLSGISGGGAFQAAVPGAYTITGTGFSPIGGTVFVQWTAPSSLFQAGASMQIKTLGLITGGTTITGVSPLALVCGAVTEPAAIDKVEFPDGSCTPPGTNLAVTFAAPTATSVANTQPGSPNNATNQFWAAAPETFQIVGTGFGPLGGAAAVRFTAGSGIFQNGAATQIEVVGIITSATTITGVSPPALVCGSASVAAPIDRVVLPDGSCTPPATSVAASFLAPTFTDMQNISTVGLWAGTLPGQFAAAVPEPFRITGAGFGPVGGTATVRWFNNAALLPPPYQAATSNIIDVPGTITSSTTIEGVSPPAAFCNTTLIIAGQIITVTLPDGSCTLNSVSGAAGLRPPTVTAINGPFESTNPSNYIVTGQDFGPIGGSAWVTFTSTSGVPNTMPFAGQTSATIVVPGTITSRTTIEGLSPEATIKVVFNPVVVGCVSESAVCDVDILLEGGSCNTTAFSSATIDGPAMTTINGGAPLTPAPSTIVLNQTDPTAFTIAGTGFGPPGSTCLVQFEDTAAQGLFDGGADTAFVSGNVVNSTTITGTLPTITAAPAGPNTNAGRLAIDLDVRVEVDCLNGSETYCNDALRFVAPPTITSVATARAPFDQTAPATPLADTWLACMPTDTTITGTGFNAAVTDLWYDTVLGPTVPIGAGLLGTIPEPTVSAPGPGTLRTVTVPTTINGASPTDNTLDEATTTTLRVLNPDQQYHEAAALLFETTGVLPNVNAGPLAGNNAEMQLCVNPTNPLNACITAHDLTTVNGQFSNQIFHAYTLDGGNTWVQFPIGPNTTAAPDGIGPAPRAFRFDPMGAFDAYGNYFAVYLVDDNQPAGPSRFCVLQRSPDGGASFDFAGTLSFPPSPGLDRETIAIGPNLGLGAGGQALYTSLVDFATGEILSSKVTIAGPGPGGVVTIVAGTGVPSGPPPPPGRFFQHGTPSVGPAGEHYISYIDGDAAGAFPLPPFADTLIFMDQDLFGGGIYMPFDVLVSTTLNAPFRLTDGTYTPMPSRGKGVIPMHKVIPVGPNAGRVVIAWSDMNPLGPSGRDTTVVTQYSDDQNLTWSVLQPVHGLHPSFQFFPWMGVDPVRGDLYLGYYDNRNAVAPNTGDVQWFVTASEDGATWTSSFLVSQAASRAGSYIPPIGGQAQRNDMLEYNGICVLDGCVYTCWGDNANFTGDNPDGPFAPAGFDVLTSVLMLDPDDN